jgi:hypothetical protein
MHLCITYLPAFASRINYAEFAIAELSDYACNHVSRGNEHQFAESKGQYGVMRCVNTAECIVYHHIISLPCHVTNQSDEDAFERVRNNLLGDP